MNHTLIYLVRHGQTEWNLQKRFQGHLDIPLSAEGLAQAEAVASWLANQPVHFTALYASDLARASQTAQAIGRHLSLITRTSTALRETHCGEWQGLSVEEVESQYPGQLKQWRESAGEFVIPGGENLVQVQTRMSAFYDSIIDQHEGEAIILVSHGVALSTLQASLLGWDLMDTWVTGRARLSNTGVTAISIERGTGKSSAVFHNSSEHLPQPPALPTVLDRTA